MKTDKGRIIWLCVDPKAEEGMARIDGTINLGFAGRVRFQAVPRGEAGATEGSPSARAAQAAEERKIFVALVFRTILQVVCGTFCHINGSYTIRETSIGQVTGSNSTW